MRDQIDDEYVGRIHGTRTEGGVTAIDHAHPMAFAREDVRQLPRADGVVVRDENRRWAHQVLSEESTDFNRFVRAENGCVFMGT